MTPKAQPTPPSPQQVAGHNQRRPDATWCVVDPVATQAGTIPSGLI